MTTTNHIGIASPDFNGQVDDDGRILDRGTQGFCFVVTTGQAVVHEPYDFLAWRWVTAERRAMYRHYGPEVYA